MKKQILLLLIMFFMVIGAARADLTPQSECTETLPDLFKRVSPSVVLISAITIDVN